MSDSVRNVDVEVVVLGGGPAGCAVAISLARKGHSVAVVERSHYDAMRIGETLAPTGRVWLRQLGVWNAFTRDAHPSSPGIVCAWGGPEPIERDFICNPLGSGWHLDRTRFDAMLARAAEAAGGQIFRGVRLRDCGPSNDRIWVASGVHEGRQLVFRARWIVDATGRAAWFAQRLGAQRTAVDRLVGIVGLVKRVEFADQRTFVEAAPDGWWYAARLSNERAVVAYLTDADLPPRGSRAISSFWRRELRCTRLALLVAGDDPDILRLTTVSANTARLNRAVGPRWIAVGDSAFSCDPLCGQGILLALESGIRAADAIDASWSGCDRLITEYADWVNDSFQKYSWLRERYYGQVTNWAQSPFWRRRRVSPSQLRANAMAVDAFALAAHQTSRLPELHNKGH